MNMKEYDIDSHHGTITLYETTSTKIWASRWNDSATTTLFIQHPIHGSFNIILPNEVANLLANQLKGI